MEAMRDAMKCSMDKCTWNLDPLLEKRKVVQNKWVYRLKDEVVGKKKYKEKLAVKGYAQQKGIDFIEFFQ